MNQNKIQDRITKLICTEVAVELSEIDLSETSSFFDDLNFDSIQLIQLLTLLEPEFSIEIDDEEIDFQIFASIKTLVNFVEEQVAEQGAEQRIKKG